MCVDLLRRKHRQHRCYSRLNWTFRPLDICLTQLLFCPAVPYRLMCARLEDVDREGTLTILAHVHVVAEIWTAPDPRSAIRLRICFYVGSLPRSDGVVDDEIRCFGRIADEAIALARECGLDCFPCTSGDQSVAGRAMLTRQHCERVVTREVCIAVKVTRDMHRSTGGDNASDSNEHREGLHVQGLSLSISIAHRAITT